MRLFAVIGKSFSGKSTFINRVLSDKKFCKEINLHRLPLIVNRKPREGETDRNEKEFISTEEINDMIYNSEVIYTTYNTEFGELIYAIRKDLFNSSDNYICDIPVGLIENIREILKENLYIIYLCPPTSALFQRMNKRSDNEEYTDKKWQEIARRYSNDLFKFGKYSNEYIAMVYGIIFLGDFIPIDDAKFSMEKFINYPPKEDYYCNVIINGDPRSFKVSTNYIPSTTIVTNLVDLTDGTISICNGEYKLDVNNFKLIKSNSNHIL